MKGNWYDSYKAAVLETDWTRIQERLQAAEREIHDRQRLLSLDHGGMPEERRAIADALHGLTFLKIEASAWARERNPSE